MGRFNVSARFDFVGIIFSARVCNDLALHAFIRVSLMAVGAMRLASIKSQRSTNSRLSRAYVCANRIFTLYPRTGRLHTSEL